MESEWVWMFRQIGQPYAPVSSMQNRIASPAVPSEDCAERQTIDIYRTVLRRLFGLHHASRGGTVKPFLFILYSETDTPDDPESRKAGGPVLTETIRRGISGGMGDLPMQIVWIEDIYNVGRDPDGEYVPDEGAVVRFNGIRYDKSDIAQADGSIHRWGLSPCGFEYVVEKKGGFWLVRSSYHKWIS